MPDTGEKKKKDERGNSIEENLSFQVTLSPSPSPHEVNTLNRSSRNGVKSVGTERNSAAPRGGAGPISSTGNGIEEAVFGLSRNFSSIA